MIIRLNCTYCDGKMHDHEALIETKTDKQKTKRRM